tara:strand:- start:255 stop:1259 length:1005 start_codon:yes stop_codon:yes gene_type:complete
MTDILELQAISKTYATGDCPAVDQVSFVCKRGQITAVIGSSGSGKTTLLRIIAGLELPDSGHITLNGETIAGPTKHVAPENRDCTLVFQDYALFPNMTVGKNVAFGKSSKKQPERIQQLLELARIKELEERYPHQISGGEQQRVALVRALATNPSLILLDEPLSHLDPELRGSVRCDLVNIFKETETTALFVSHDTEDALTMADQVVVLQEGAIAQVGSPLEIYSKPVSRYVALLFGKTNLISTKLIPDLDHHFTDQKSGEKVVSIRPHQWRKVESPLEEKTPTFSGKITSVISKGTHQEIGLDTESLLLTINFPAKQTAEVGAMMTVAYDETA